MPEVTKTSGLGPRIHITISNPVSRSSTPNRRVTPPDCRLRASAFVFTFSSPIILRMGSIPPTRSVDTSALGPCLVIGACVILAIRTARREARIDANCAEMDWQQEIDLAITLANKVMIYATSKHASLFRQRVEPFTTGVVEEDIRL